MVRKYFLVFLIGVIVGGFLSGRSVTAQTAQRIFGTVSGAAKAILVDSDGKVRVTGS